MDYTLVLLHVLSTEHNVWVKEDGGKTEVEEEEEVGALWVNKDCVLGSRVE